MSFIIILHARLTRPGCLCEIAWQRAPPFGMSLPPLQINLVSVGFIHSPVFPTVVRGHTRHIVVNRWCAAWEVFPSSSRDRIQTQRSSEESLALGEVKIHSHCNAILCLSVFDTRRLSCAILLLEASFKPSETLDICCSSTVCSNWSSTSPVTIICASRVSWPCGIPRHGGKQCTRVAICVVCSSRGSPQTAPGGEERKYAMRLWLDFTGWIRIVLSLLEGFDKLCLYFPLKQCLHYACSISREWTTNIQRQTSLFFFPHRDCVFVAAASQDCSLKHRFIRITEEQSSAYNTMVKEEGA